MLPSGAARKEQVLCAIGLGTAAHIAIIVLVVLTCRVQSERGEPEMSWGDPKSPASRAVVRRARKGLNTYSRRLAEQRSQVPNTFTRRAAEARHHEAWESQEKVARPGGRRWRGRIAPGRHNPVVK